MLSTVRRFTAAAILCALVSPAFAQAVTELTVTSAFGSYTVGSKITDPNAIATILAGPNKVRVVVTGLNGSGTPSGGGAPPVIVTQTDYTANSVGIPPVGAPFGSTGPYANYVLVGTIPANPARLNYGVLNASGAQIVVVFDDGSAAAGAAPANATAVPYAAGAGVGAQGGSLGDPYFKGRVQIYAPSSSAFVPAWQN